MRARWAVPLSLLSLVLGAALVCPGGDWADELENGRGANEQPPAPAGQPDPEEFLTRGDDALSLTGVVLDPAGQPVAGAEVSLAASAEDLELEGRCPHCGEPLKSCAATATFGHVAHAWAGEAAAPLLQTRSDPQGRFRFEGLRRVSFAVWAHAPGYGEGVRERAAPGEALELRLTTPRVLQGRVRDEEGRPVPGASVSARSRIPLRYRATSGADGTFKVTVGDGPFYVVASAAGHLAGGRTQFSIGAAPLELVLPRERTLEVAVTRAGRPAEAAIRVVGEHLEARGQTEDGYLRFTGLPPGTVQVYASQGTLAASARVQLREDSTRADLALGVGGTLAVTVLDAAGQPVPQPRLTLSSAEEGVAEVSAATGERVMLGPVPPGDYSLRVNAVGFAPRDLEVTLASGERALDVVLESGAVVRGRVVDEYGRPAGGVVVNVSPTGEGETTGPDGRFVITLPMPGVYELNAHHSDWGGTDAKVTAPADGIELALHPKGGLRAQITSEGQPLEGATLLLRGGQDVFFSDRPSGAEGVALMRGLPAGDYQVAATHPDHLPSSFQRVTLTDGQTVEVSFALSQGARIKGRVIDETGRPVQGAMLTLVGHRVTGEPGVLTSSEGTFQSGPLQPDRMYRVQLNHPEYESPPPQVARAGGPELAITLKAKQRFLGTVVGKEGGAVQRFTVDGQPFTSAQGRFEAMLAVQDGEVGFVVSAAGYVTEAFTRPAQPDLGTVELLPSPKISGRVVDTSGAPVADAEVGCQLCDSGTLTGEDGRFQLSAAGSGVFEVTARKGNRAAAVRTQPDAPVVLQLRDGAELKVRVFDELGNPSPGEAVETSDHFGTSRTLVTGQDGSAPTSLPPGDYLFQLNRRASPALRLKVDAHTREIVLGPAPGTGSLQVQVAGYGYMVWVVPGRVEGVKDPRLQFAAAPVAYVGQYVRNQVLFTGLPPGDYTVAAVPGHRSQAELKVGHATVGAGQTVLNLR